MAAIVWVRGIKGRLARAEPNGPFLPVDRWTIAALTEFVKRKADVGDLEISHTDPDAPKPKAAAPEAEPAKKETK